MYKDMYRQFSDEIDFKKEQPQSNVIESKGLIDPRRKIETPDPEQSPTDMVKEWMEIIRNSGSEYRKKVIAQHESAKSQTPTPKATEEAVTKKAEEPEEESTKKSAIPSIFDEDAVGDEGFVLPRYSGPKGEYVSLAREAAAKEGIPEDLFLRQIKQESNFNPNAKSSAGAYGLGQLMPGTAAELGVDASNPVDNLRGAARYLKQNYEKFGSWDLALAAYNAGSGNVQKYGGIPPFKETQQYVKKILGN